MSQEAIAFLRDDPDIGHLIADHGDETLASEEDLFERLIVSILRQQVSAASANATRERLEDAVELTPVALLRTDCSTLRDLGLSRQKASYAHNVAAAFVEHDYSREYFAETSNDAVIAELTDITGVGTWTAKMQLMFTLGRPDVFPVEDLGIRNGMCTLYGDGLERSRMEEIAERWRPYRSYASLYLWRAVD
ncbi:3-methyladenine DNA glycosylase [Halobellus salinus]|uniref:3-methyladenine DNA glycosylase n=1 Tax=Halobellus salinus TaxID=931585 RepID=A0A830EGD8_9EURY|nr:DNA-3-methyladenine glycosylase 2 family protein [Halobellus salinus]GGJ02619.1 3-methyladenine DNA glycosylase [Halobellus salinus]SMP16832.1 DNA-3-methyladenine glycosylase II [Halobellus salinus]